MICSYILLQYEHHIYLKKTRITESPTMLTRWVIPKQSPGPYAVSCAIINFVLFHFCTILFNMTYLCEPITNVSVRMQMNKHGIISSLASKQAIFKFYLNVHLDIYMYTSHMWLFNSWLVDDTSALVVW